MYFKKTYIISSIWGLQMGGVLHCLGEGALCLGEQTWEGLSIFWVCEGEALCIVLGNVVCCKGDGGRSSLVRRRGAFCPQRFYFYVTVFY